jgi:hypothetical protein
MSDPARSSGSAEHRRYSCAIPKQLTDDAESLKKIPDVMSNDFARFGKRDGLQVTWRPCS